MNNNRNTNRRRGRGGNRQQGGGQQLNRIDSRARGNAPQLLEKYRKLAHDAHLNGDRVQEEYYLQFADHYFRVIADQRARQEESRQRREDRWQDGGETERDFAEESDDYSSAADYRAYEQSTFQRPRDDDREAEETSMREAVAEVEEPRSIYEPPANPFVRDARGNRGLRPRRNDRRPRDEDRSQPAANHSGDGDEGEPAGLDPSMLPPAISSSREEAAADSGTPAAAPRRRTRRSRPPADDAGEELAEAG